MGISDAIRFHRAGDLKEAERLYRLALQTQPKHVDANHNLGVLLVQAGNPRAALRYFQVALQAGSGNDQHLFSFIECLLLLGRPREALAIIEQAEQIGLQKDEAERLRLRVAAATAGRPAEEALPVLEKCAELLPMNAEIHHKLGSALYALGRLPEAEACYRRAIELDPGSPTAHNEYGILLIQLERLAEGEASYRRATDLKPDYAVAHLNLANALSALGRLDEAKASFQRALLLEPGWQEGRSVYLCFLAYTGIETPESYLRQAREWEGFSISAAVRESARARRIPNGARRGRRLRIGYVSGDFKSHPVSIFMAPLLECHDRTRAEVFAYSSAGMQDGVTKNIQRNVEHWHSVDGMSDDAAVALIAAHRIDVLVDLSGHTRNNRLGIFARRAAPVQCHYLGYFASTGLTEMDYWIADSVLVPEDQGIQYCEKIWRLPRVWVGYRMSGGLPDPVPKQRPDGKIRVGTFNHLGKINDHTLALWARVLHEIQGASLLLKSKELEDPVNRRRVLEKLHSFQIPESRVDLRGRTADWGAHMDLYNELDIALDPVGGSTGSTTTCEGLSMGTPIVTLAGRGNAGRMTSSMLTSIGHEEWIAVNETEYVEKAVRLARGPDSRARLRVSLRESMRRSALCDVPGLARSLEDGYEAMFDACNRIGKA